MKTSYIVIFTIAIARGLRGYVNGQSACSTIEDSLQSSGLGMFSHISPSVTGNSAGDLLALFTSTKFKCYGSIQSWSGIIHLDSNSGNLDNHSALMHLQVWRPHEERSYFSLVGSSTLTLQSMVMNTAYLLQNDTVASGKFYHEFTIRLIGNASESHVIYFQPEDVLGCYIPAGDNSPGFGFWNFTGDSEVGMNMLMFSSTTQLSSTTRLKCEVSICDASMVMIRSVLPQIIPHYVVNEDEGSGDEGSGKVVSLCSDESVTMCKGTTSYNDCSSELSGDKVVPGLLAVIAVVCLAIVCIVGITSNTIILCYARCKIKRKRYHLQEKRNSDSSLCNFIVNPEDHEEFPNNIRSLADFLQYNMHNKSTTTESYNVTWV